MRSPEQADDQAGEPFLGESGKLFDNMLLAMGATPIIWLAPILTGADRLRTHSRAPYSRTRVYLAHVAMCRPPEDRKPGIWKIGAMSPFLFRQLGAGWQQTKGYHCLDSTAARTLIPNGPDGKAARPAIRYCGQWHEMAGFPVNAYLAS